MPSLSLNDSSSFECIFSVQIINMDILTLYCAGQTDDFYIGCVVTDYSQLTKYQLRHIARSRRDKCLRNFENLANDRLIHLIRKQASLTTVAGYMPIKSEICPLESMYQCYQDRLQVCVPVVTGKGQPLQFHKWTPYSKMIEGTYGARIPETDCILVPDLIITPMLAYDRRGYRLGYGGGYYDRTLLQLAQKMTILTIGFAFYSQEYDKLPTDAHDQKLNAVVTDQHIEYFDNKLIR